MGFYKLIANTDQEQGIDPYVMLELVTLSWVDLFSLDASHNRDTRSKAAA